MYSMGKLLPSSLHFNHFNVKETTMGIKLCQCFSCVTQATKAFLFGIYIYIYIYIYIHKDEDVDIRRNVLGKCFLLF